MKLRQIAQNTAIAIIAAITMAGSSMAIAPQVALADYNHNAYGFIDSCQFINGATTIYGWAHDGDDPNGSNPTVTIYLSNYAGSAFTVNSDVAGYRTSAINSYINSLYPGTPLGSVYGFRIAFPNLQKGSRISVSGYANNIGTGVSQPLYVNNSGYVDGDSSRPYFAGGIIPDACLTSTPTPTQPPTPVPTQPPTPVPTQPPTPVPTQPPTLTATPKPTAQPTPKITASPTIRPTVSPLPSKTPSPTPSTIGSTKPTGAGISPNPTGTATLVSGNQTQTNGLENSTQRRGSKVWLYIMLTFMFIGGAVVFVLWFLKRRAANNYNFDGDIAAYYDTPSYAQPTYQTQLQSQLIDNGENYQTDTYQVAAYNGPALPEQTVAQPHIAEAQYSLPNQYQAPVQPQQQLNIDSQPIDTNRPPHMGKSLRDMVIESMQKERDQAEQDPFSTMYR